MTVKQFEVQPIKRPRFRFLTLVLVVLLVLAGVVATLIKLEQDRVRTAAFEELQRMGFSVSIGGGAISGRSVRFIANPPPPSQSDLRRLTSLLADWTRPHDLGFSPGLNLELLHLRGTSASDEVIAELKGRFPRAMILH